MGKNYFSDTSILTSFPFIFFPFIPFNMSCAYFSGTSTKLNEVTAPCEMNMAYYAAATYDGAEMKLYVNGEFGFVEV